MNTKNVVGRTAGVFVALTIAGMSVAVSSRFLTNALDQTIMIAVGSAIFGAALTFLLVRIFELVEK